MYTMYRMFASCWVHCTFSMAGCSHYVHRFTEMFAVPGLGSVVPKFRELLHAQSLPSHSRLLEPSNLQCAWWPLRSDGQNVAGQRLDVQVRIYIILKSVIFNAVVFCVAGSKWCWMLNDKIWMLLFLCVCDLLHELAMFCSLLLLVLFLSRRLASVCLRKLVLSNERWHVNSICSRAPSYYMTVLVTDN